MTLMVASRAFFKKYRFARAIIACALFCSPGRASQCFSSAKAIPTFCPLPALFLPVTIKMTLRLSSSSAMK